MSELTWWLIAGAVWFFVWFPVGWIVKRDSYTRHHGYYDYVDEQPAPAIATRVEAAPLPAPAPVVNVNLVMPGAVPVPAPPLTAWVPGKEIEG